MSHGGERGGKGGILVRFQTLDGMIRWRNVPSLDHATLCRAGGLAEGITWFDVPKSFAGGSGRGNRTIEGRIHQGPLDSAPIGTITIVEEREKIRDDDFFAEMRKLGCELPPVRLA